MCCPEQVLSLQTLPDSLAFSLVSLQEQTEYKKVSGYHNNDCLISSFIFLMLI